MVYIEITLLSCLLGYFISQDRLFKPLREKITKQNRTLGELVSCPKCLSFWFWLFVFSFYQINKAVLLLIYPLMSAICAYIIFLIVEKLKN
jgi:hypothetical protein